MFYRLNSLEYVRYGYIQVMADMISLSECQTLSFPLKRSKVKEILSTIIADQSNQVSESEYIYSVLGEFDSHYEGDLRWFNEVKGTLRDQVVELIQG